MSRNRTTASAPVDRPVVIMERWIDAARPAVFAAWTTPEALVRWWGPHGMRIDIHEMAFRVGGVLRFAMTAADGTVFPNRIIWKEIVAPERLLILLDGDIDNDPMAFTLEVVLEEVRGGTLVRIISTFPSMEAREAVKKFGAVELGQQSWDKLADFVESGADTSTPDLELVRMFNAPRERVWQMWTVPEHFKRWWGPHGFDCPVAEIEPRAGSPLRLAMRQVSTGDTHYVTGEVLEVDQPWRIVLRLRAFGTAEDPGIEHVTTVTLSEFRGTTVMKLETRIVKLAPELREAAKGMGEGMSQSLEKMAAAVASG